MKKKNFALKLSCYLISLIMVATGVCTTSYAATDDGSNDAGNSVETEQQETTAALDTESDEGTEPETAGNAVQSTEMTVKFVGINENTKFTSGSTDVKATISWDKVEGSEGYTITGDGITKATATASETEKTITIPKAKKQKYTVTVATQAETTDGDVHEPLAKGTVEIDLTKYITDLKIETKTMHWSSDTQYPTLGKKLEKFMQQNENYEYSEVAVSPTVTLTWTKVDGAKSYKVLKYVTDSNGKIDTSIEPVDLNTSKYLSEKSSKANAAYKAKLTESGSTETFVYNEYVEESKFSPYSKGYYTYRVVPVFDNDTVIPSTLGTNTYNYAIKNKSYNNKTRNFVPMKKFLDYNGVTYQKKHITTGIRTYNFSAKTNTSAKVYKKGTGLANKGWIKKGVTGYTVGGSGSKFEFHYNGKTGYVMRKKLSCTRVDYSPYCDWTRAKKESYVNSNKSKFNTEWVIWVSRYSQTVNVFHKKSGKYVLTHISECTTGKFRNYTSSGTFRITNKWWYRTRGSHHYYYLNFYNGMNSVHGPTYYNKNNKIKAKPTWHLKGDASWGTLGCVRTYTNDAYYVRRNCPVKSRVVVY